MTRAEMLKKLSAVKFEFLYPESEWEDIGFTEQPIWVNSNGYGYVMCDEHIECGECDELTLEKWISIKKKLKDNTLTIADVEGTSLETALPDWLYEYYRGTDKESDEIGIFLSKLENLSDKAPAHLWWMEYTEGGYLEFFDTEDAFKKAYERDDCDYSWDELDDDILKEWIDRLCL